MDDIGNRTRARREHHYPIGQKNCLGDAVGHKKHRLAIGKPQSLQFDIELIAGERIKRTERLIHEEQHRIIDQRPADRHALAHAP